MDVLCLFVLKNYKKKNGKWFEAVAMVRLIQFNWHFVWLHFVWLHFQSTKQHKLHQKTQANILTKIIRNGIACWVGHNQLVWNKFHEFFLFTCCQLTHKPNRSKHHFNIFLTLIASCQFFCVATNVLSIFKVNRHEIGDTNVFVS